MLQGRGFTILARAERNRAQNGATAAREVRALIGDSVDKLNHGTRLVNESGATLCDIVGAVSGLGTPSDFDLVFSRDLSWPRPHRG